MASSSNLKTEGKCKECEHAIFCPTMGEYKCVLYQHRVYFPELQRSCFVKAKTPVLDKKCQCKVCQEKGYVEDDE